MQFVDFFAGIGGIRLGLEQAGHKCVGFCEFDKYARKSYKAMYNTEGEWENHDVRTVKPYDVPAADLWSFGFPCQDISVAGKQKGLQEGERSGLFYEIMRLLAGRRKEDRPKWLLVENVKNLLSIGNGFDFARLLCEVGGYGYSLQWDTLNSKDFGVPQNRERVFIIGYLGNICGREVFPLAGADRTNPCELKEAIPSPSRWYRVYDGEGLSATLASSGGGGGAKTGLYAVKIVKPYGTKSGIREFKITDNKADIASTCAARDSKGISRHLGDAVLVHCRIRRLTPRECWRLQGFPDSYFDKAKAAGISDTQLYKQAGNGVTVNVARAIGERLKEIENEKPICKQDN